MIDLIGEAVDRFVAESGIHSGVEIEGDKLAGVLVAEFMRAVRSW